MCEDVRVLMNLQTSVHHAAGLIRHAIGQGPADPAPGTQASGENLDVNSFLLGKDKGEKGNTGSNEKGKEQRRQ